MCEEASPQLANRKRGRKPIQSHRGTVTESPTPFDLTFSRTVGEKRRVEGVEIGWTSFSGLSVEVFVSLRDAQKKAGSTESGVDHPTEKGGNES
jgi:hypothetical protein